MRSKCYGSTIGSNPISVGSTPTDRAQYIRDCGQVSIHLLQGCDLGFEYLQFHMRNTYKKTTIIKEYDKHSKVVKETVIVEENIDNDRYVITNDSSGYPIKYGEVTLPSTGQKVRK